MGLLMQCPSRTTLKDTYIFNGRVTATTRILLALYFLNQSHKLYQIHISIGQGNSLRLEKQRCGICFVSVLVKACGPLAIKTKKKIRVYHMIPHDRTPKVRRSPSFFPHLSIWNHVRSNSCSYGLIISNQHVSSANILTNSET